MTQFSPEPVFADYSQRPASQQWEQVAVQTEPRLAFWIWHKPPHFPNGFLLLIPEQIPRQDPAVQPHLTMRALLSHAGIDPSSILSWSLNGMHFESQQGQNPLLDLPIPDPVAGVDPSIYVTMLPAAAFVPGNYYPQPMLAPQMLAAQETPVANFAVPADRVGLMRPATTSELELLDSIDVEWNSSLALENDLARHRKMVTDMLAKLKSLNRDLNTDERTYSNSQDKRDWQDARRWLRDCHGALARSLKEYDIGFTSRAGQRTWFEETHIKFVVPRKPFEGLTQAHADYQIYHKSLQTLLSSMRSGLQHASQNGEKRAQRILVAIAAKVRQGGNNSTFLGVITGS